MAFPTRKILFVLGLLLIIGGSISALTQVSPATKSPSASRTAAKSTVTRADVQLVKHDDGELILEWKCPDVQLSYDEATHRISGIDMPGAAVCEKTGVPRLPQFSQLLDCLPGPVTAQIVDMEDETRQLGNMLATPEDFIVDTRTDSSDGPGHGGSLDEASGQLSWSDRALHTPLVSGMWPAHIVNVNETGVFRGHRLVSINVFPVQVDAQRGIAHIIKRIKVRVSMPRNSAAATANRLPDQPDETALLRTMLGVTAPIALSTRTSEALQGHGAPGANSLDDFDPYHPRWKIIVNFDGVVRVTGADLQFAGCPIQEISANDTHLKNRGHEIPIHFSGEEDGRFDENDYIEFYGTPNRPDYNPEAPSLYNDPWTAENVYWLSWGDGQPGLRMINEDATYHTDWPQQQVHVLSNVRSSVHFESDTKYERLPASTNLWGAKLAASGPMSIHQDHWFWGLRVDGLTTRNFNVYLPYPDARSFSNITVRAALRGYSYFSPLAGPYSGYHRAIVYLNGQTAPGLSAGKTSVNDNNPAWRDQSPLILQTIPGDYGTGIVSGDLISGNNTVSVSLPGDGLAGSQDKILADWFEVEYDRELRAITGFIKFRFDTTRGDTFSMELRGFRSSNIGVWKVNRARLTNLSVRHVAPADELPSWAAQFQVISDGPCDILAFDDGYPRPPLAILPETSSRDLRTMTGARYLIIYHDSFAGDEALPWLQRLDSLRRVSFNGSVDTIRVSQIYEQFNDGIVSPDAIHSFLQYAYEHWPIRPTHVCLVGDGVLENRGTNQSGNLIPSLYPLTLEFGAAASDMLFGNVSGPPWDIIPDIAVGRISCRSAQEFELYVRKLVSYEDPSQNNYNSLFHCTAAFITDKTDVQFRFDRDFSEPAVQLLPREINVTRVYLDSMASSNGQSAVQDAFRSGAALMNYNGHGGGGVWSNLPLIDVAGVRLLNNRKTLPFITNFTCYVGSFDAAAQADVLGEAFEFGQNTNLDPVGGIGVYSSTGVGWAEAGKAMQRYLFNFCAEVPGLTLGEIVQMNKAQYWGAETFTYANANLGFTSPYSMMMMMTLLGDPGVRLALPQRPWSEVHADTGLAHIGDTLRVSGTLPWDPAGNPTQLYLLPYNGNSFTYYQQQVYDPARAETVWTVISYPSVSHIPAFDPNVIPRISVTTQNFSNLSVPITSRFNTPSGWVVAYAANPGYGGAPPQDAIGSFPLFLADSLNGLRVTGIEVLPDYRSMSYNSSLNLYLGGYIPNDSLFQVQVNLMHPNGVARVKARGVLHPAQGPVVLDTVELTQQEPGLWRSSNLGPYVTYGGTYRMRFSVQPPGGDFEDTPDYDLPVIGRHDFVIDSSNGDGIVPHPVAGSQPMFYVPIGYTYNSNCPEPSIVPVRLSAIHDSSSVILDSFTVNISIRNVFEQPSLFELRIPTYFWPQMYRVSVRVDPDNIIPETNEFNNSYSTTIALPNLYPATNALGSFLPRTSIGNTFHRFWRPGIADTLWLLVPPGALPVDSTTLIYMGPDSLNAAALGLLSSTGLYRPGASLPDSLRKPVYIFRTTLADSSEALVPGTSAQVALNFSRVDSSDLERLAIFEKRAVSPSWRRLENVALERVKRDTTLSHGIRIISYSGKIRATTSDAGQFAVFGFVDTQGPTIDISVDGMHFTPHSILPRHPQIFANLTDASGIDRSPGKFHIVLDNDTIRDSEISWSDSLQSAGGMSALIRPVLDPGDHVLRVMATDNTGISDTASVTFSVSGAFGIDWAINYPNPFQKTTTIAYLLTDVTDDFVECKIYTVSGRYIRTVRETDRAVANYREIMWDGRDDKGEEVANGVYFARIRAKQGKQKVEKIIKLAKVR
jgi:hypothetical protein